MTNFDLIAEAIERMNAGDNETAIARLKQFTALNTPKLKNGGKVKMYDWVSKDDFCPALKGIYHDENSKVAVATDRNVLIVSKNDYNEECAGKIIDKKGDEVKTGKYPNYKAVFPAKTVTFNVYRDKIAEMLSKIRAERKIEKTIEYAALNVGHADAPLYLTPRICKLLLTLPAGIFSEREQPGIYSPLVYKSDDGNYEALLMPMMIEAEIGQDMLKVGYAN